MDLQILSDQLANEAEKNPGILREWFPMLIAMPQAYWSKSQNDFAASCFDTLKNTFPNYQKDLIPCPECSQYRTFVGHDGRLIINSGEVTLMDLNQLKTQPKYRSANSILILKETSSGIEARIVDLSQGHLLYSKLADHTTTLAGAHHPLNLARELERRRSGQALNYVFIDLGIHPNTLLQVEFLEQWGARNQHLSGFALSFVEPVGSIGGTYHYLLPANRKLNFSLGVFITLDGMSSTSNRANQTPWAVVTQWMVQYAISGNYAMFATINSKGNGSIGISFLNPVLFPFLL
jgi:hypothetical protein